MEEREGRRHQCADVVERARARCGTEERLQFGEGQLDRIEVGTAAWREKSQERTGPLNRHEDLGLLVGGEVVEDDDIAGAQRGHQDLFDVSEERWAINGPIEHRRRAKTLTTERGDHRVGLPVTAGRVIAEPRPAGCDRSAGGDR